MAGTKILYALEGREIFSKKRPLRFEPTILSLISLSSCAIIATAIWAPVTYRNNSEPVKIFNNFNKTRKTRYPNDPIKAKTKQKLQNGSNLFFFYICWVGTD